MNLAAHTKQNSGTNLCTDPSPTPQEKSERGPIFPEGMGVCTQAILVPSRGIFELSNENPTICRIMPSPAPRVPMANPNVPFTRH